MFYWFIQVGLTTRFLRVAALIVAAYLALNAVVIGCGVAHLLDHPELWEQWLDRVHAAPKMGPGFGTVGSVLLVALATFPQLALGLSGFELSMATAPLIHARPDDDPEKPRGRIRRARLMMLVAAAIMSVFVLGSMLVVTLLVREEALSGAANHRALAWLAHGGNPEASPLFGAVFGSLYDLSSVLILFLAGASATISLRDLVPHYLALWDAAALGRAGWRHPAFVQHCDPARDPRVSGRGVVATGSLRRQRAGAADGRVGRRLPGRESARAGSPYRSLALAPFILIMIFFLGMALLTTVRNISGLAIALGFIGVVLTTGFASRWFRSTELRFDGFLFADDASRRRWEEIKQLEFQALVPHRPGMNPLATKEADVRERHRLGPEVPLIFIEVELGDPSDFLQQPFMKIEQDDGREVIRVSRAASIAHVLAAIGLEFRLVGRPPEMIFGWSEASPLAANLDFLLMGRGNVPWMVHDLIRRAEPNRERQPRVVIG